jgi:aconitate hydratase
MALNVAQKLIQSHLLDGDIRQPGSDIALKVDQVLLQDVLGTLVMQQCGGGGEGRRLIRSPAEGVAKDSRRLGLRIG